MKLSDASIITVTNPAGVVLGGYIPGSPNTDVKILATNIADMNGVLKYSDIAAAEDYEAMTVGRVVDTAQFVYGFSYWSAELLFSSMLTDNKTIVGSINELAKTARLFSSTTEMNNFLLLDPIATYATAGMIASADGGLYVLNDTLDAWVLIASKTDIRVVTTNTTIDETYDVIIQQSTTNRTHTLPSASTSVKKQFRFVNNGAGTLTVNNAVMHQGQPELTVYTDGTNWINSYDTAANNAELKQTKFPGICATTPIGYNDISINYTTRVLTITPPLGYFHYFIDGDGTIAKYTVIGNISFPAFTNTSGVWYLHFDATGAVTTQTAWSLFDTIASVYRILWNSTLSGAACSVAEAFECHLNTISGDDHLWKHTYGSIKTSGITSVHNILASGSPSTTGLNTCIGVASGTVMDDNLLYPINNNTSGTKFSQDLGTTVSANLTTSNGALFLIKYDSAGEKYVLPATRFPFDWNSSTNIPNYITAAGVRTPVTSGRFFVYFTYAFQDPRAGQAIKIVSATTQFTNQTDSLAYGWDSIKSAYPTLADNEIRVLGKYTFEYRTSYSALVKYSVLRDYEDLSTQRQIPVSVSSVSVVGSNVIIVPTGNLSSNNAQSALIELQNDIDTLTPTASQYVYVSSKGNDTTGSYYKDFLTLEAARDFASVGDTIWVKGGSYTASSILGKEGVNWHFENYPTITCSNDCPYLWVVYDNIPSHNIADHPIGFRVTGTANIVVPTTSVCVPIYLLQPTFPVHIEYNTLICRKASTTPCSISSNVSIIHRGSTVSKTAIALSIGGSAKLDIQGDYVYSTNAGEALDTSVLAFGLTTSQGSRDTTYCKFNYISNGLCYFRSNFLFEFAQADILELKDTVGIGICNGTCNALTVGNELLTGYINYIGKIHVLNMNGGLFCAHTDLHTLNMSGGDLYLSGTARYAFTKTGGNFYGRALGKTYDSLGSTEYTFVGDSTGVTALAKLNAIATATLAAITAFSSAGVELFSVLGSGIIKIRESSTTVTAAANYLQMKATTTGKLLATTSGNVVGWLNAIVDHTPATGDLLAYDGTNYTANSFLSIRTGAFSNSTGIQLDRAQTYYNNYTVNAPLAIAKAAGDVVGGFADITLVADGTNIPTISWATMATNSALYNNTAAAKNHYMFFKTANGLYYSIENL